MRKDYFLMTDPSGNAKFRFTERFDLLRNAKAKLETYRNNPTHAYYKITSYTYKSDYDLNPIEREIETNVK